MFRISTSVLFMPTRPIRPTAAMVSSTLSMVRPSPGWNTRCFRLISRPVKALSSAAAILAAQEDYAPSHTMPPMVQMLLVMVSLITWYSASSEILPFSFR